MGVLINLTNKSSIKSDEYIHKELWFRNDKPLIKWVYIYFPLEKTNFDNSETG